MMLCKPFVFLLLTLLLVDILLVDHVTAWRRRRRRRCSKTRPGGVNWVNNWDGQFKFDCGYGKSISRIKSHHLNCVEDRIWYYSCQSNIAATSCFWTVPVNSYDGLMNFNCPHNGFIAGVWSWHNNQREDRQFKFKCCHDHRYYRSGCKYSILTSYDQPFDYTMYSGYYLAGAWSSHSNHHGDRSWKFLTCQRVKKG